LVSELRRDLATWMVGKLRAALYTLDCTALGGIA
jgi:hypothetical protein